MHQIFLCHLFIFLVGGAKVLNYPVYYFECILNMLPSLLSNMMTNITIKNRNIDLFLFSKTGVIQACVFWADKGICPRPHLVQCYSL